MKPLLLRACGGFLFWKPTCWGGLGGSLAISLAAHLLVLWPFGKNALQDYRIPGGATGRIQARIALQYTEEFSSRSIASPGVQLFPVHDRKDQSVLVPSTVFAKKPQSTAAINNSASIKSPRLLSASSPKVEGAEIGGYRISLARAVRRGLLTSSRMPGFVGLDELQLELHFIKPGVPPAVSIIQSSGSLEVDRTYVESVIKAAEMLAHPGAHLQYPYRIELKLWFSGS